MKRSLTRTAIHNYLIFAAGCLSILSVGFLLPGRNCSPEIRNWVARYRTARGKEAFPEASSEIGVGSIGALSRRQEFLLHIHFITTGNVEELDVSFGSMAASDFGQDTVCLTVIVDLPLSQLGPSSLTSLEIYFERKLWPHGPFSLQFPRVGNDDAAHLHWRPSSKAEHIFLIREGSIVSPLFYAALKSNAAEIGRPLAAGEHWGHDSVFGISLLPIAADVDNGGQASAKWHKGPLLAHAVAPSCQLVFPRSWKDFRNWQDQTRSANESAQSSSPMFDFESTCTRSLPALLQSYTSSANIFNLHLHAGGADSKALCGPPAFRAERAELKLSLPALEVLPQFDSCLRPLPLPALALKEEDLEELLSQVQRDNAVVAVMASDGFDDMLKNWLCFVREIGIRNFFIISTSMEQAESLHRQGVSAYYLEVKVPGAGLGEGLEYGTIGYKMFIYERTRTINRILRLGYHILLADVDAVWLSDPFQHMRDARVDIYAQLEPTGVPCGGFLFFRNTHNTLDVWNAVTNEYREHVESVEEKAKLMAPEAALAYVKSLQHVHEQRFLTRMVRERNGTSLTMQGLDRLLFPNGRDFFQHRLPQKAGVASVVIHNNYILGKGNKIRRFRDNGLWRLDSGGQLCTCLTCPGHPA